MSRQPNRQSLAHGSGFGSRHGSGWACRRRPGWRHGYLLFQYMVIISVVVVLVSISARRRLNRLAETHTAYMETTCLALAQSGAEAAISSLHSFRPLENAPLGRDIELTGAVGDLEVAVESVEDPEAGDVYEITSCASVRARGRRATRPAAMRCVFAVVTPGPDTQIVSWRELSPM